jgi:hypothetical protein
VVSSSSSSTDTPPVIETPFIEFTKNSECLITCLNPCNTIHDTNCKNNCKRIYDINYNPFLNVKEVIATCEGYGYIGLELQSSNMYMNQMERYIDEIYDLLFATKSVCVFKYFQKTC